MSLYRFKSRETGDLVMLEPHGKRILEVGCGKGFNSVYLASQCPARNFVGIDLTPLHVALAQKAGQALANLRFARGNFQQLDFPDHSFDLVFGVETLCHASDVAEVYAELFRVLRPGGRVVIFDGYRLSGDSAAASANCVLP